MFLVVDINNVEIKAKGFHVLKDKTWNYFVQTHMASQGKCRFSWLIQAISTTFQLQMLLAKINDGHAQ